LVVALSQRARSSLKPAVMCWQTITGAWNFAGSAVSTSASARGPPSEAAIATR
jgi:hypothetical protein